MAKKYINTESDFTLLLNLPEGYDGDFRFVVATDGRNSLKASRIGGVLDGCETKGGQLYMVVRHGSLQPGRLRTKTYLWIDNEWVEDLQQMVPAGEDIILTAGMKNTDAAELRVDVLAPYVKGKSAAKTKLMPWGLNDKVIVNKTIPLEARPGSKYFFEHWMSFRCFDPFTLKKVGEEGAWKCSSEESRAAVSKAVLVTIPKEFATECKSFYENNDYRAIEAWLREKKCVRDCTENPYTGATTSPDFVVQSNRIICVKKIDLRPLLDYKGQDEWKPALPSMIKDIISTQVEFTRRRVVPEWASNLPAKPEGKDACMYREKHVIRKGWKNNPFEVIPLGRHGKRSIFSEKLIMSKYNTGHDERDNYFRFRKA